MPRKKYILSILIPVLAKESTVTSQVPNSLWERRCYTRTTQVICEFTLLVQLVALWLHHQKQRGPPKHLPRPTCTGMTTLGQEGEVETFSCCPTQGCPLASFEHLCLESCGAVQSDGMTLPQVIVFFFRLFLLRLKRIATNQKITSNTLSFLR